MVSLEIASKDSAMCGFEKNLRETQQVVEETLDSLIPTLRPSIQSVEDVERLLINIVALGHLRDSCIDLYDLKFSDAGLSADQCFSLEGLAKARFVVVMNGIVASYSLMQGLRCILSICTQSPLTNKPLAWLIFALDQTMAYFSLAAAAAAVESAYLAENGQTKFQWMKVCFLYEKFCHQIGEGLVSTFLVSLSLAIVSGMSTYHLFRLYGTKGKSIQ